MNRDRVKSLLKTVPGFGLSAFFIWWTYIRRHADGTRGFDPAAFRSLHMTSWVWVAAVVVTGVCGYSIRCMRWWWMLRKRGSRFLTCSRVLMTSLAANNVLPLRIGDVMRVFTYAPDLNVEPSEVLSTVILEKLLDVFTLAVFMVVTMHFGKTVPPKVKLLAEMCAGISTAGLLILIFGAKKIHAPLQRFAQSSKNKIVGKVEHYLDMAVGCIESIGVAGTLMLVVFSFVAWGLEALMYTSIAKLFGFTVDLVGPWQGMTEANLSFILPSSPGGIGLFETACKDAMSRHGLTEQMGVVFGTVVHLWLLVAITGVGGAMFFAHRMRRAMRRPLIDEVDALPSATDL